MQTNIKPFNELDRPGATGYRLPPLALPHTQIHAAAMIPDRYLRKELLLPELSEHDVTRQMAVRGRANTSVDNADLFSLGSCTMIYTPHAARRIAEFEGLHPWQPVSSAQGALEVMYELNRILCEFGGAATGTLQPAAGAHSELTAMLMIEAYHRHMGDKREFVLIPDSAHGTNPATAAMSGYRVVQVASDKGTGRLDINDLETKLSEHGNRVAALMMTQPSTYGIYDEKIREITAAMHRYGAQVFCDGANFAALTGRVKLCDLGVDAFHFNLHKTYGIPHGGGGPGAGFVGVKEHLARFLPTPVVERANGRFALSYDRPFSIGTVSSAYGNFLADVMAYQYILLMGSDGFREASGAAVLHGNYLHALLSTILPPAFPGLVAHEGIVLASPLKPADVAKGIIDGAEDGRIFYAPTVGFPIHEGLLTEPTHSASKEAMDAFAERVRNVVKRAGLDPSWFATLPHNAPSARIQGTPQEAEANRNPVLTWDMSADAKKK